MNTSIDHSIEVQKNTSGRVPSDYLENPGFGTIFTNHMMVCDYSNGKWEKPKIIPYGPVELDPSARVFHYGQSVFEGMKAYRGSDDKVWLFRPLENIRRLNNSAKRMAIPEFPEDIFLVALQKLLILEKEWIAVGPGKSLYIRPLIIATESGLAATEAAEYKMMILCSPVTSYYSGDVKVLISEKYNRAADGGVGFAKTAGNYAAQFYPTALAKDSGFQQLVWTDANTHQYLEESGTMNIFFRIGNSLVTAPTSDRILDGITRKSILHLAEQNGIETEVRKVAVKEIISEWENDNLLEMFGTGTAAVVVPIRGFGFRDQYYELPDLTDSYMLDLKGKLEQIQYGLAPDDFNWRWLV